MRKLAGFSVLVVGLVFAGCGSPTLPETTEGGGWIIESGFAPLGSFIPIPIPEITDSGNWKSDGAGAQGSAAPFTVTTNVMALAPVDNGRVPAEWNLSVERGWAHWLRGDHSCSVAFVRGQRGRIQLFGRVLAAWRWRRWWWGRRWWRRDDIFTQPSRAQFATRHVYHHRFRIHFNLWYAGCGLL